MCNEVCGLLDGQNGVLVRGSLPGKRGVGGMFTDTCGDEVDDGIEEICG